MAPPRDRKRSRHRAPEQQRPVPAPAEELAPHDPELESYLAALAPDAAAATELTGRFGSQVLQIRLPALRVEQLRRLAEERGLAPGALAAEWLVERLDREDTPTGPLPVVEDDPAVRRRAGRLLRGRRGRSER